MTDTATHATDAEESSLSSGFDVRLVGQESVLEVQVHRSDDLPDEDIICNLEIASVSCREGKSVMSTGTVTGSDYEDVAREAVSFVTSTGERIRNLTRFRYDMESAVGAVDRAIRQVSTKRNQDPRDETVSVSIRQVEDMLDDLPMDIRNYVDKMLVDAFKEALRNVVTAAYDAGYRAGNADADGNAGGAEDRDLFDYEEAVRDADFEAIRW